jgi:hypothetical protein
MLVLVDIDKLDMSQIYLGDRVTNKVKDMNWFQRLGYSTPEYDLTGIYIYVPLKSYLYKSRIEQLIKVESTILNNINMTSLTPVFSMKSELSHKTIFIEGISHIIVKISGVWETNDRYGLTFKIRYH